MSEKVAEETPEVEPGTLSLIAEVAEQRRKEAQPVIERKLPAWLIEVAQTEVSYTLSTRMIPTKLIDFDVLRQSMHANYNIEFKRPRFGPLSEGVPGVRELPSEQLGQMLLGGESPRLVFEGGRFKTSKNDFVEISQVTITGELIYVVVKGVSQVAELVAKEVAEFIWMASGVQKRWEDIEKGVQLVGYGTGTIVDFGVASAELIDERLRRFLQEDVINGQRFAASMGSVSRIHDFSPSPNVRSIYTLESLEIRMHHFDEISGRSTETVVRFHPTDRSSSGTSRLYCATELSFDEHLAFLESLRKRMLNEG